MAVLTCNDLTKYFDHALALDHVNLEIQPGRIVGLLGPNGSGKTTLIKLAHGLLTPSSGELRIDGQLPSPATRELVSYLPERPYLADWMTVSQLLDFFCDFYANFDENASIVISTHLIADVENILDDVIFIRNGGIMLQSSVDEIRQERGCSVDELFREVFRYVG